MPSLPTVTAPPRSVPPIFSPAFVRDPLPTLAWLRDAAPLYLDPSSRMIIVTRYPDVEAALRHPGLSAAGGQRDRRERAGVPRSMLTTDGAEHAALRRPAMHLLGPAAVRRLSTRLAPRIASIVTSAVDGGGPVDALGGIGEPLATAVLAEVFGCRTADRVRLLDAHARAVQITLDPVPSPGKAAQGRAAMAAFHGFLETLLQDVPPDTGLAELLADPEVSREDVAGILSLSLVGGWSPLAEVFVSGAVAMTSQPALRELASSTEGAARLLEEILRWHTPIPFAARRAVGDVVLPSGVVPSGAMVLLMLGAANRDPSVFTDPDAIRPDRDPGPHLALGGGAHFCMGAALIRATLPVAWTALSRSGATREPGYRRGEPVGWQPVLFPRRPVSVLLA